MIVHYFKNLKKILNFNETECVKDVSDEHFEEVSCELQMSSNFEEHVDITTKYLGRYMAQGGAQDI